ncbi:HAD family hydrolase [Litorimonas sp. RW-G-Af-16]|uniref:HAD family hydrolase n=1 Tax=Litorimonas sp. RW-G-Af-16 TaxID=3241168 RepID=UPI00390C6DF3
MSEPRKLAIFDLDYTITKRGTWGRLVMRSVRFKPWLWVPMIFSTLLFQYRYKTGKAPRGDVKKSMMNWGMTGKPRAKLTKMAERFAEDEVPDKLRPGALRALAAHREAGDYILIASAAVDLIVAPISKRLGADGYVCTELAWDSDDRLLPEFASENCYGEAKRKAVERYIEDHKLNDLPVIFYTDSMADIEVLRMADIGIAVDPDTKMTKAAGLEGYEIQHWMT